MRVTWYADVAPERFSRLRILDSHGNPLRGSCGVARQNLVGTVGRRLELLVPPSKIMS